MMGTLHALQTIDDSEFERTLVPHYLRRRDPQLAGLIATGVNEEGKPIPCPVDNILYVPGDPPRCVAVASTTMSRRELRRKWLGSATRRGDIEKAAKELERWRAAEPDLICTLYLATNRPLASDVDLYREAIAQGRARDIEVQIVEASQLVDFLDHNPEGQYLREELFGIEAERLSENLLRRIAYLSLSHHRRTFAIGEGPQMEVRRDAHREITDVLEKSAKSLVGLRGASGTGKSTLLRQVGYDINAQGGVALWVPAEEIASGTSIANMLLNVLRRFHPPLNSFAGDDAIRLATLIPGGLMLLVDDVNRLPASHRALNALRAWETLASGGETPSSHGDRSRLRFVVPLWPGQLAADSELLARENTQWELVELHPYSPHEKAQLASILSDSHREEVRQIIEALNGDPFLCGLASADMALPVGVSRSALVRRIYDNALHRATVEAVRARRVEATPNEYVTAIDDLVNLMLQTEEPEPQWEQVREALGDRKADLLYILGRTNQLGWIDTDNSREVWRWKHDRLRDALVGRWLANSVLPCLVQGDDTDEIRAWLSDPGLAEAWALALAFLPDENMQASALTVLAEHQPLALAEVLRLNLFPVENNLRQLIASGLQKALTGFDERVREFVGSPQRWILEKLSQTNDPLVLEVTEGLQRAWYIWAARLRNGDVPAGLEWIKWELARHDFLPGMHYSLFEQAIEAFAFLYDSNRDYVANELTEGIKQPELSPAAMTLAGYLAWPELSWPIWEAWNTLSDTDRLGTLVPAVWALSRCGDESIQLELETTLLLTRELADEEQVEGNGSQRYWQCMQPLWMARRWPITSAAAETWARVARDYSELRETLCYLLRGVDHPATMEVYVRWSAEKGGTLWDEAFEPVDPLAESDRAPGIPTSPAARDRLWEMIENESDQTTRRIAFRFWKRSATATDLERLRGVSFSDPLFDEVLKMRLKLRDRTAISLLIERMRSDPGAWCGYAPLFYNEAEVAETLLDNFETALDDRFGRSESVPLHLPTEGVRRLVEEKQTLLLKLPRIWPMLWCSDVPGALTLVQKAVAQANPDDLKFFFMGWRTGFPFPVSQRMLGAVVPVLERFSVDERERLAELAVRNGFEGWVQEHLPDVIEEGKHFWLTAETAIDTLTDATRAVPKGVQAVLRDTGLLRLEISVRKKYNALIDDIIKVVKGWLGPSPDRNQLTVAAMLVAAFGTGSDISWWRDMRSEDEPECTGWANALYILRRRGWQS